jgi:putative membrane protein
MRLFVRWVACSLLLWAAAAITNSFGGAFSIGVHGIFTAPISVALLSLANLVIGPLAWLATFPLRCCTFGLVSFLINGIILYVVAWLVPGLEAKSFWAALVTSVLYTVFCTVAFHWLLDGKAKK